MTSVVVMNEILSVSLDNIAAWQGVTKGKDCLGWHHPGGDTLMQVNFIAAEFYKGQWKDDHLEGGERLSGDDN